jgi:hypothetical protein
MVAPNSRFPSAILCANFAFTEFYEVRKESSNN